MWILALAVASVYMYSCRFVAGRLHVPEDWQFTSEVDRYGFILFASIIWPLWIAFATRVYK